ncbi:hypothetical protein LCGC14_1644110 [marine sediment metagenome]|uniref:Uncharacterized protein n=1 Tax=marine sediment metagenome TaxID=412755 RepID=A0A0F9HZJ3_9ZZZZ
MTSLKDEAENYEAPKTKNIADLEIVSLANEVFEEENTDGEGKPYKYKYMDVEGEKHRVPNSVLDEIKTIIKENPEVTHIKVIKTGTGMNTSYKVVQKAVDTEQKIKPEKVS